MKAKKKIPAKVLINTKILESEKSALKTQAKRYCRGNITKLVRLVARGYFEPRRGKFKDAVSHRLVSAQKVA